MQTSIDIKKELYFENEINHILNEDIKRDLKEMINLLPDYFFTIPASSTGKYHPAFASGNRGLIRHTKVAVQIAYDLLSLEMYNEKFTPKEKDLIIYALILHDGLKCGIEKSEYTLFTHPILISEFILAKSKLNNDDKELVSNMVRSHMGQWNTNKYEETVLPKPKTKYERFVHICDYLASRKYIDVKFNSDNNVEI